MISMFRSSSKVNRFSETVSKLWLLFFKTLLSSFESGVIHIKKRTRTHFLWFYRKVEQKQPTTRKVPLEFAKFSMIFQDQNYSSTRLKTRSKRYCPSSGSKINSFIMPISDSCKILEIEIVNFVSPLDFLEIIIKASMISQI